MRRIRLFSFFITLTVISSLFISATAGAQKNDMIVDIIKKIPDAIENVPDRIKNVAIYSIQPDPQGKVNIDNLQDQITTALLDKGLNLNMGIKYHLNIF